MLVGRCTSELSTHKFHAQLKKVTTSERSRTNPEGAYLTQANRSFSTSLRSKLPTRSGTPGAPYLPDFGRCGIPRMPTPNCASCRWPTPHGVPGSQPASQEIRVWVTHGSIAHGEVATKRRLDCEKCWRSDTKKMGTKVGVGSKDLEKVRGCCRGRSTAAMRQCADNRIQHLIKPFPNIFCKKPKHKIAVLLQQKILSTVAPVRFDAGKMLFAVQLNRDTCIRAQQVHFHSPPTVERNG